MSEPLREAVPEKDAGVEILNLGGDFPPVSTATWEAAIARDLKGADYEKKLVWRTEEGLAIRPYYRKEALDGLDGQLALQKLIERITAPASSSKQDSINRGLTFYNDHLAESLPRD